MYVHARENVDEIVCERAYICESVCACVRGKGNVPVRVKVRVRMGVLHCVRACEVAFPRC